MSELSDNLSFYQEQWPILSLPGWEETGAHAYGLIWWQKDVPTVLPDMTARLRFFVGPTYSRVSLEVRHRIHGMATKELGSGRDNPQALIDLAMAQSQLLELQVQQAYEAWSAEVDATYQ